MAFGGCWKGASVELHGGLEQAAQVLLGVLSGRQLGHSLLTREEHKLLEHIANVA